MRFVLARDSARRFCFAALQSERGRQLLAEHGLQALGDLSSVVLLQDGKAFVKSDAALAIASQLDPPWPFFARFTFLPRPVRDTIYDFIGTRRYQWFGKKAECGMPTGDLKDRFID